MEINVTESTAETIIENIEHSYAEIVRLYHSVPVTALETSALANGWSVKDLLAHIAAWEWRCASLLKASHTTDTPLKAEPDVNALNQEIYRERQAWDWEDVEYDFRAAHRAVLDAIREFPPNRLAQDIVQQSIAAETWKHYTEHLPDLQRWRKSL